MEQGFKKKEKKREKVSDGEEGDGKREVQTLFVAFRLVLGALESLRLI